VYCGLSGDVNTWRRKKGKEEEDYVVGRGERERRTRWTNTFTHSASVNRIRAVFHGGPGGSLEENDIFSMWVDNVWAAVRSAVG
jgi:hypothetical protein